MNYLLATIVEIYRLYQVDKLAISNETKKQKEKLNKIFKNCQTEMTTRINMYLVVYSLCQQHKIQFNRLEQKSDDLVFDIKIALSPEIKKILAQVLLNLIIWGQNDKFSSLIKYLLPLAEFTPEILESLKKVQFPDEKIQVLLQLKYQNNYSTVAFHVHGEGRLCYLLTESVIIGSEKGLLNLLNFIDSKKLSLSADIIATTIFNIFRLKCAPEIKTTCIELLIKKFFSHHKDASLFLNSFQILDEENPRVRIRQTLITNESKQKFIDLSVARENLTSDELIEIIFLLKPYLTNGKFEENKIIEFVNFLFFGKHASVINFLIKEKLIDVVELSNYLMKKRKNLSFPNNLLNLVGMGIVLLEKENVLEFIRVIGPKLVEIKTGFNPLLVAINSKKYEIISLLLEYGIDPCDSYSQNSGSPLILALEKNLSQHVNDFLTVKLKKCRDEGLSNLQIEKEIELHSRGLQIMQSLLSIKNYQLIMELAKLSLKDYDYELRLSIGEIKEVVYTDFLSLLIENNNLEAVTWLCENYKNRDNTKDLLMGLIANVSDEIINMILDRKNLDVEKAYLQTPNTLFHFAFEKNRVLIIGKILDLLPPSFKFKEVEILLKVIKVADIPLLKKILLRTDFNHIDDYGRLTTCLIDTLSKGEKGYLCVMAFLNYLYANKLQSKIPDQTFLLGITLYTQYTFTNKDNRKSDILVNQYASSERVNIQDNRVVCNLTFNPPSAEYLNQKLLIFIAEILLEFKVNLNQKLYINDIYWTPLTLACLCNEPKLVEKMIANGASLDFGLSRYALGLSAYSGFDECVNKLLQKGNNNCLFDELSGYSVLDLAVLSNSAKIVALIINEVIRKSNYDDNRSILQRKMITAYKLLKSQQDEIRTILEENMDANIVSKLKQKKSSYQIVLEKVAKDSSIKCHYNAKTESIFQFYDNDQLKIVKIANKDLASLNDGGEQFINNMIFNQEMKGLFGYRIKKIASDVYKMRPTGKSGDQRIYFYRKEDKNADDTIPVYEAHVRLKAHK